MPLEKDEATCQPTYGVGQGREGEGQPVMEAFPHEVWTL